MWQPWEHRSTSLLCHWLFVMRIRKRSSSLKEICNFDWSVCGKIFRRRKKVDRGNVFDHSWKWTTHYRSRVDHPQKGGDIQNGKNVYFLAISHGRRRGNYCFAKRKNVYSSQQSDTSDQEKKPPLVEFPTMARKKTPSGPNMAANEPRNATHCSFPAAFVVNAGIIFGLIY